MGYASQSETSRKYSSTEEFGASRKYGAQSSEENILPLQKPQDIRKTTKVSITSRPFENRSGESASHAGDETLYVNQIIPFDRRPTQADDRV
ncbi:MAG: hypothetical protein M4579_001431 [Chaenotheca gracillima]|nr:MAG: hypothetical protein M4579_001431 [Chaenotheca gracillima]